MIQQSETREDCSAYSVCINNCVDNVRVLGRRNVLPFNISHPTVNHLAAVTQTERTRVGQKRRPNQYVTDQSTVSTSIINRRNASQ